MAAKTSRLRQTTNLLQVKNVKEIGCRVTSISLHEQVEVGTRDGWLCFWTPGREIRIGPLTAEQAEKISEDLGYEAVSARSSVP